MLCPFLWFNFCIAKVGANHTSYHSNIALISKEDCKGKSDIGWGPDIVAVGPVLGGSFGHLVQDAMKGEIPEHVVEGQDCQEHCYSTRNGHIPKITVRDRKKKHFLNNTRLRDTVEWTKQTYAKKDF